MSFTISRHSTTKIKQKLIESDRIDVLQEILQPTNIRAEQKFTNAISSHWEKFLPSMSLYDQNGRLIVRSQGVANLTKFNLWNTLRFGLRSLRCGLHYFKSNGDFRIFLKILRISWRTKRMLNFDMTKHGILFSKLKGSDYLKNTHGRITVIGDGFGFAGCLIKAVMPNSKIHYHNLSPNTKLDLLFASMFLKKNELNTLTYSNAEFTSQLPISEVFINVASFGEMKLSQVSNYLQTIRDQGGTLISLNRDSKTLPSKEVIKIEEYGWVGTDEFIMDEPANFYLSDPSTGQKFDGPFRLTVAKLNKI